MSTGNQAFEGSSDTSEGIVVSTTPDFCLTPSGGGFVVVGYNIWAKQADDARTTPTVRLGSLRAHNMGSLITTCHGDEAGTGGGVKSHTHNGICEPKGHSTSVFAEGKEMIRNTDAWWMNNRNTVGKLIYVKDAAAYGKKWEAQGGVKVAQALKNPPVMNDASPSPPQAANDNFPDPQFDPKEPNVPKDPGQPNLWKSLSLNLFKMELNLIGQAGQQLEHMGHLYANPPLTDIQGHVINPEEIENQIMKSYGFTDKEKFRAWVREQAKKDEQVRASGKGKKPPCRCVVGPYEQVRKLCILECGPGSQAHHIVADQFLGAGGRAARIAGDRIAAPPGSGPLPSFKEGQAICLQGNAGTEGTEHNIGHENDKAVYGLGAANAATPGLAPLSDVLRLGVAGAIAARPDCAAQIISATNSSFADVAKDMMVRAQRNPISPNSPAGQFLNPKPNQ